MSLCLTRPKTNRHDRPLDGDPPARDIPTLAWCKQNCLTLRVLRKRRYSRLQPYTLSCSGTMPKLFPSCEGALWQTYSTIGGEKRKDVRLRTPFFSPSASRRESIQKGFV